MGIENSLKSELEEVLEDPNQLCPSTINRDEQLTSIKTLLRRRVKRDNSDTDGESTMNDSAFSDTESLSRYFICTCKSPKTHAGFYCILITGRMSKVFLTKTRRLWRLSTRGVSVLFSRNGNACHVRCSCNGSACHVPCSWERDTPTVYITFCLSNIFNSI
jgi:hypothetical protein